MPLHSRVILDHKTIIVGFLVSSGPGRAAERLVLGSSELDAGASKRFARIFDSSDNTYHASK